MTATKYSIKQLQEDVTDKSRDIWLAGLGVFSTVEEEGTKLFSKFIDKGKELVDRGEELEKKGRKFGDEKKDEVAKKLDDAFTYFEDKIQNTLETVGLSTRNEVKALSEKVDQLTESVAALAQKLGAPKGKSKTNA